MQALEKALDHIEGSLVMRMIKKFYQTFLVVSGIVMLGAMIATVFMRYVLKTDLFGLEELICAIAMWFYFMGSTNGSMEDSQIKAEIVSTFVKNEKVKWIVQVIAYGIEVIAFGFMTKMSLDLLIKNFELMPTTPALRIPYVIPQTSIFFGFGLMTMYSLGHMLRKITKSPASHKDVDMTE